jgi:hypothetical protein
MNYTRPVRKEKKETVYFAEGAHQATIKQATLRSSKDTNRPMIRLVIEGQNEERAYYNLTFETEYTEENLGFLLASIEDNGVAIPAMDFGYTHATAEFLKNKKVYIDVVTDMYQGKARGKISTFLTIDEYDQHHMPSEEAYPEDEEEEEWEEEEE